MAKAKKACRKDRRDAKFVQNADPMHVFMPYIMLGRADNEAVMNEDFDIEEAEKYLAEKNRDNPEFKYTLFHLVIAAIAKTIYLRPRLNRFMIGYRLYERHDISFCFVVKKKFDDVSDEAVVVMKMQKGSELGALEQVYQRIKKEVYSIRKENQTDGTTDIIAKLGKLPRPILKFVAKTLFWLDYHDWLPQDLIDFDPYHSTCFLSNIGSIKMTASYHHLINWGTNSLFVLIGEKTVKPFYNENGEVALKKVLPCGMTIDERISDGFYFAKSIKVVRYLLKHPNLLDLPLEEPISMEEEV